MNRRAPESPRPLIESGGRAARILAGANDAFEAGPAEEARAWASLAARQRRPARRWLTPVLFVAGAAAFALLAGRVLVPAGPRAPRSQPEVATARRPNAAPPPAPVQAPAPTSPARANVEALRSPGRLAPGASVLAAGVRARLAPQGVATLVAANERDRTRRDRTRIVLEQGTLEIDARPAGAAAGAGEQPAGVEVRVGPYRVEGDAASFEISAGAGGTVDLVVQGGRVAVWSSQRRLARVVAGQRWASRRGDGHPGRAALRAPDAPATQPAPPAAPRDCLLLARSGSTDRALACFEGEAAQSGLAGELALVELARIRRDVKGDIAGAERALAEHRRRFPHGALAAEAGVSRIELLLRLGRADEALAEAERLPEGDGTFWRAVCLGQLGRRAEARRAFDAYLARPGGARRAEAARRRQELGP